MVAFENGPFTKSKQKCRIKWQTTGSARWLSSVRAIQPAR